MDEILQQCFIYIYIYIYIHSSMFSLKMASKSRNMLL